MAKSDEKLMAFVEEEMKKDPDISTTDLFEKARKTVPAARSLTIRAFHARYPLQVKRRASLEAGGGKRRKRRAPARAPRPSPKQAPAARDAVRAALLKFASDLSAAEARKDLVKVLSRVDDYVAEVLKAAGR